MQALKDGEDAVEMIKVDADAVVADRELPACAVSTGRNLDLGRFRSTKLYSVGDQVLKNLSKLRWVSHHQR